MTNGNEMVWVENDYDGTPSRVTAIYTGDKAIAFAASNLKTLNKFSDPMEDARTGLSVREAIEIAKEDPSLIWVKVV